MKTIFGVTLLLGLLTLSGCAGGEKEAVNPAGGAAPAATPPPDIVYEKGFYPLEKDAKSNISWRWMGTEGIVKVKNTKKDMSLKIAGTVPMDRFPQPPTITISVNGAELEKFPATVGAMEKLFTVPAAKLGTSDFVEVKIATSKAFVPKDSIKGATDPRELGFSLTNLTWQPK